MTVKSCEKVEKSQVALTIEVNAAEFEAAVEKAYQKMRRKISVPGFRPGKAPRKMIERMYGAEVFFEEAINIAFPEAYEAAAEQEKLQIVGYPTVEMVGEVTKDGFTFKATTPVYPEVTLGEYKGLKAEKPEVKVLAADVDERLKALADRNTRLVSVDRAAKSGDTAVIDFEGFLDGKPFDGGKGENHELEIGSGSFVPGFEDQVIGMKAGEEKDIDITFPENYHADLAGKAVVFKVKVHEVKEKEVPAMDDEFAKDVSEYDTLDELKAAKREELEKKARRDAETEKENAVVAKAVDNAEVVIPDIMVERQIDAILNDIRYRLSMQGVSLEDYMKYTGTDMESFRKESRIDAARRVKSQLVIDAVAKAEDIKATEEEINAKVDEYCAQFGDKAEEFKKGLSENDKKFFADQIMVDKTLAVMTDTAVEVEKAEKKPAKKASARKTKKAEEKTEEKDAE